MPDQVISGAAAPNGLVARALSCVDIQRPGAREAANLLLLGRRPATTVSYAGKFDRFFRFHEQIEQGFPPLCAMPALPSTVLMHLGWLSTEDKVHAGSLHPYLSAINQCHIDFGFAALALGHDVCLSRKAFGYVEGQHTLKTSHRGSMPSSVMLQILHLGLHPLHTYSATLCLLGHAICLVLPLRHVYATAQSTHHFSGSRHRPERAY
jgi:hypothetical protein